MKRRPVLAALALLSALPVLPQNHVPGSNRLDYLAGYLSLTDSQKAQAKTIFDAAATALTTAQGQMTAAREALTAAVKANKTDSELDRLAAAVGVVQGSIAAINAKAETKFYALLTAEQKAKYDAMPTGGPRRGLGGGSPKN
ncbi:MAG: Spy/CpxP family protein refolding chaperone [Acidobacteria bacterium]|nr:Spy/CpxP family protein refolding chaperone [Acidobacteriota bacterium]